MSFFDDISMGLGLKKKDDAYRQRTAETISRNQGSEAADRYRGSNPLEEGAYAQIVDRSNDPLPRYAGSTSPFYDFNKDTTYGRQNFFNLFTGKPLGIDPELDPNSPEGKAAQADLDTYLERTAITRDKNRNNFMNSGMSQAEYAQRQQDRDNRPAPTITDPNAPNATDPESTIFNPNNAFLRERMRMQQEQGGGIMPPTAGTQPTPPAPPPPQMPMLPSPRPAPQMPPQLRGIMGLADRSNISPAMRYAAENYYRLGGRQMMDDEFERGRGMIQGQSV